VFPLARRAAQRTTAARWFEYEARAALQGPGSLDDEFTKCELHNTPVSSWYWPEFFARKPLSAEGSGSPSPLLGSVPAAFSDGAVLPSMPGFRLDITTTAVPSAKKSSLEIVLNTSLAISCQEPMPFDSFEDILFELPEICEFIFGFGRLADHVHLCDSAGVNRTELVDPFYTSGSPVESESWSIQLHDKGVSLAELIGRWLAERDKLTPAVRFLATTRSWNALREVAEAVQQLEGLHRSYHELGRTGLSLASRLTELAGHLPPVIRRRLLTPMHGPFIRKLVHTRDYVSHGESIEKEHRFTSIAQATPVAADMRKLVRTLVLLKLGVPSTAVAQLDFEEKGPPSCAAPG